ncbi:MAG: methyltransferase [Desulfobacterales bacterium]|nr:methyltransferase [Desulfobacterales bacterium]
MKITIYIIYAVTFITGLAGLIYQVAWQKYLGRLLGSDSIATAIILAAFLGGLSLGYYLCGKITTRVKNHLKAYAILEGIIGAWCLNFPIIFKSVESLTQYWTFSPLLIIVQGFFCSALLMGIPTVAMGGTIPFLTRGISKNVEEATHIHARVYAVNTAGAFLGTLLAGFYLVPEFGLPLTVMGAAFLNIGACLFFYFLPAVSETPGDEITPQSPVIDSQPPTRFRPWILGFIAFLSGFYVMTLENVLIRITSFSMGSSSYTFSLIVSVFILSIAVGSYAVDRLKNIRAGLLFANQLVITLSLVLIYISLDTWPYWAHVIRISFQSNTAAMYGYYFNVFLILLLILALPVGFMGATVPITFHEIKRDLKNVGKHSGILFSLNTMGSLFGSLIGGIVFYYFMNNAGVFLTAAFFAAVSTCLAGWQLSKIYFLPAAGLAIFIFIFSILTPFYNETNFVKGTFMLKTALPYSFKGPDAFFREFNKETEVRFYKDGPTATVSAIEYTMPFTNEKPMAIMVNGKPDSSTLDDISTLKLLAHIPALLSEKRKDILVIGLGTGVTAGELTLYSDTERIDVAEISPSVIEALPYFHKFTYNVHENRKVSIHTGDAFRIMGRSRKKWDIIISEPSNPWVSGVDLLFTREFYKLANNHLNDKGILLQWVQAYSSSPLMLGMMVNTVKQEFTEYRVFMVNSADLLIVASKHELSEKDTQRAEKILNSNERVRKSLKTINIKSADSVFIKEIWSPSYIAYNFSGYDIQTMDNPRLHYIAGNNFFIGASISPNFLFNSASAYHDDFLLREKYKNWNDSQFSYENIDDLILSSRDVTSGYYMPITPALERKAHLMGSDVIRLTQEGKKALKVDIIPFIMSYPENEEEWEKIGLKEASFRKKAEFLITQMKKTRNWITPYPVDGLKELLLKGMSDSRNEYEKNWCALRMAALLSDERADKNMIMNVLDHIVRDAEGNIIIRDKDKTLLKKVSQYIRK